MPIDTYISDAQQYVDCWRTVRDVLAGPEALRAAGTRYLPRNPGQAVFTYRGQRVDEYANYVARSMPLTYAAPLLNRLVGVVFRKAPAFTTTASVVEQLGNVTLSAPAVSGEGLAKQLLRELITTGWCGVMVDYDDRSGRPYQRVYRAEAIRSWRFGLVGATPWLTRLILHEQVVEPDPGDPYMTRTADHFVVCALDNEVSDGTELPFGPYTVTRYRREETTGDIVQIGESRTPLRRGTPLGAIPFVPLNPWGTCWQPCRPPLMDLCDLILGHYRNSADLEHLLHKCAAGTVLFGAGIDHKSQEGFLETGAGRVLFTELTGASLQYVQTSGAAGVEITSAMDAKKAEMAVAAGRLLLSQQKNVAESGAALELQFAGEDATLQQMAGSVAMALEEALRLHTWWDGYDGPRGEITVELNDQFLMGRLAPQDVMQLTTAAEAGAMTDADLFWNLKTGERLDPSTDYDSWRRGRHGLMAEATDRGAERDIDNAPDGVA